jgi:hypothetical protein
MAKILIAAGAAGTKRLRHILGKHHALSFATTLQEALDFAPASDLLICGLEFDESRMFELLRVINNDSSLRDKPRVCMRFIATNTPDEVIGGLELAARAVGARELIDIPALEEKFGPKQADAKVKEIIDSAISDA